MAPRFRIEGGATAATYPDQYSDKPKTSVGPEVGVGVTVADGSVGHWTAGLTLFERVAANWSNDTKTQTEGAATSTEKVFESRFSSATGAELELGRKGFPVHLELTGALLARSQTSGFSIDANDGMGNSLNYLVQTRVVNLGGQVGIGANLKLDNWRLSLGFDIGISDPVAEQVKLRTSYTNGQLRSAWRAPSDTKLETTVTPRAALSYTF